MEVPRLLLAIAGKFPRADYIDARFSAPEGDLAANLGRMPVIETDGQPLGQSVAINFFLASKHGLAGSSAWETAQILAVGEHLKEMLAVYLELMPYFSLPSEEKLNQWFDEGATDSDGPADRSTHGSRYLKWWMGRIEKTLGDKGFAVGDKLSLADVLLFVTFGDFLKPEEAVPELPEFKRVPFADKARVDAALELHPKIKASVHAVANHPNVQRWLAIRGVQRG